MLTLSKAKLQGLKPIHSIGIIGMTEVMPLRVAHKVVARGDGFRYL
jgi:hypothetical protein